MSIADFLWLGIPILLFTGYLILESQGNVFEALMSVLWLVFLGAACAAFMWLYDSFIKGSGIELVLELAFGVAFFVGLGKMFVMLCRGELGEDIHPPQKKDSTFVSRNEPIQGSRNAQGKWGDWDGSRITDQANQVTEEPDMSPDLSTWKMIWVFGACLAGAILICAVFTPFP